MNEYQSYPRHILTVGAVSAVSLIALSAGAYYATRKDNLFFKSSPDRSSKLLKRGLITTAALGCAIGVALSTRKVIQPSANESAERKLSKSSQTDSPGYQPIPFEPGAFAAVWTPGGTPSISDITNSPTTTPTQVDAIIRLSRGYKHISKATLSGLLASAQPLPKNPDGIVETLTTDQAIVAILTDPAGLTQHIQSILSVKERPKFKATVEKQKLPIEFYITTLSAIKDAEIWFF